MWEFVLFLGGGVLNILCRNEVEFSKKLLLVVEIIQGVSIYFPDQGERFEAAYLKIFVNI